MKSKEIIQVIGKRIFELRKSRGMTRVFLADFALIHEQSIRNLEAGKNNTGIINLVSIAKVLGTNVGHLVDGIIPSEMETMILKFANLSEADQQKVYNAVDFMYEDKVRCG